MRLNCEDSPLKSEDLELGCGWLDHHIWVSCERNIMNIKESFIFIIFLSQDTHIWLELSLREQEEDNSYENMTKFWIIR